MPPLGPSAGNLNIMLCWIVSQDADKRMGHSRHKVKHRHTYTESVRNDLFNAEVSVSGETDMTPARSASAWKSFLTLMQGHVLGCALIRPKYSSSPEAFLSSREREVADYWMMTPYQRCVLIFVDIVEVVRCDPVLFRTRTLEHCNPFLFGELGQLTHNRLIENKTCDGQDFYDVWAHWSAKHGCSVPAPGNILYPVIVMPTPHAILITRRSWHTWVIWHFAGASCVSDNANRTFLCGQLSYT